MDSKRRTLGWLSNSAAMAAASIMVLVVGCALEKDENRPQGVFNRIGGHGNGQVLEAKRCVLKVAILKRPLQDPALNEIIWRAADEQLFTVNERHALDANGLRVGRVVGDLPIEVESVLNDETPQKKVTPSMFAMESGDPALIMSGDPVEQVSLIVTRDKRATGKDYRNASGFLRVVPKHDGTQAVLMRIVPEIHYGDVQKTWQAAPNTGQAPQEFTTKFAQPEDVFRELGINLVLEPHQVAVIGCKPERTASLGSFLLTQSEPNSDLKYQKLILIWASRNMAGVAGDESKASDRPKRTKRNTNPIPLPDDRPNRRPIPKDPSDESALLVPESAPGENDAGPKDTPAQKSPGGAKANSTEPPTHEPSTDNPAS